MTGEELLQKTISELDSLISANTIIGDAIDAEDKIIIPIAALGFGFGAGEGGEKDKSGGAGTGAGGGVSPVAIIVVHKNMPGAEGVQVLSLKKSSQVSEAISTIAESVLPQVVEAIKGRGKKEEESEAASPTEGSEE